MRANKKKKPHHGGNSIVATAVSRSIHDAQKRAQDRLIRKNTGKLMVKTAGKSPLSLWRNNKKSGASPTREINHHHGKKSIRTRRQTSQKSPEQATEHNEYKVEQESKKKGEKRARRTAPHHGELSELAKLANLEVACVL